MTQHTRQHQDAHISGDDQIPEALISEKGLMSSSDKIKLNGTEDRAERNFAVSGGSISFNALVSGVIEADLLTDASGWGSAIVVTGRTGSPTSLQNDVIGRIVDTVGGTTEVDFNFVASTLGTSTYYFTTNVVLDDAYFEDNVATQYQFTQVGMIIVNGVAEYIYSYTGSSEPNLIKLSFVKTGAFYIRLWNGEPAKTVVIGDDQDASEVNYDNSTSGMTATDVQGAVDELDDRIDAQEVSMPPVDDVTLEVSPSPALVGSGANQASSTWGDDSLIVTSYNYGSSGSDSVGDIMISEIAFGTSQWLNASYLSGDTSLPSGTYYVTSDRGSLDLGACFIDYIPSSQVYFTKEGIIETDIGIEYVYKLVLPSSGDPNTIRFSDTVDFTNPYYIRFWNGNPEERVVKVKDLANIPYDNTVSGMVATNPKDALDELQSEKMTQSQTLALILALG